MPNTPPLPTYRLLRAAVEAARPVLQDSTLAPFQRALGLLEQTHRKARNLLIATVVEALAFGVLAFQKDYAFAGICALGLGICANQLNTYRSAERATRIQLERKLHYSFTAFLEPPQRVALLRVIYPRVADQDLPASAPSRGDGYLERLTNLSD